MTGAARSEVTVRSASTCVPSRRSITAGVSSTGVNTLASTPIRSAVLPPFLWPCRCTCRRNPTQHAGCSAPRSVRAVRADRSPESSATLANAILPLHPHPRGSGRSSVFARSGLRRSPLGCRSALSGRSVPWPGRSYRRCRRREPGYLPGGLGRGASLSRPPQRRMPMIPWRGVGDQNRAAGSVPERGLSTQGNETTCPIEASRFK
jgi:hypothetical protein